MREQQGLIDRFVSRGVGFFVACGLVYLGVQLLRAVIGWLIAIGLIAVVVGLALAVLRWRRERW